MKRIASFLMMILALHGSHVLAKDPEMKQTKQYNTIARTYSDIFAGHNQLSNTAYFSQFDKTLKGALTV